MEINATNKQKINATNREPKKPQKKQEQHDAFRSDLLCAEVNETNCCYENEGTENPST